MKVDVSVSAKGFVLTFGKKIIRLTKEQGADFILVLLRTLLREAVKYEVEQLGKQTIGDIKSMMSKVTVFTRGDRKKRARAPYPEER